MAIRVLTPETLRAIRARPALYASRGGINLTFGGPGSGCHGDNCGRPSLGKVDAPKGQQPTAHKALLDHGWKKVSKVTRPHLSPESKQGKAGVGGKSGVAPASVYTHPVHGKIVVNHSGAFYHKDKANIPQTSPVKIGKYGSGVKSYVEKLDKNKTIDEKLPAWAKQGVGIGVPAVTPAWVSPSPFTFKGDAKYLGGAHEKYLFTTNNQDWLFKPAATISGKNDPKMAFAEQLGSQIATVSRPGSALLSETVTLDVPGKGPMFGSMAKMIPGLRKHADFAGRDITTLKPWEVKGLQQEQVIDWLISNHDSHAKQFLRTKDNRIIGIDKAQAFKFIGQDKLSVNYHPNVMEKEPIYNAMWRAVQEGKLKWDSRDALPTIQAIEKMSSTEYQKMLAPYAQARFGTGATSKDAAGKHQFYEQALARKENIRKDFEKFYGELTGTKDFTFGSKNQGIPENPKPKDWRTAFPHVNAYTHAVIENTLKYYTAPTSSMIGSHLSAWQGEVEKAQKQLEKAMGRVASEKDKAEIAKVTGVAVKHPYIEAAALAGYTPQELRSAHAAILDWTGSSKLWMKEGFQRVLDGKTLPSSTAPGLSAINRAEALRGMTFEHAYTYARLKQMYPDGKVTLVRGISSASAAKALNGLQPGEVGEMLNQGAHSWSDDLQLVFKGTRTVAKVPIEYVLTSHKTNQAAFYKHPSEQEFIVAFPGKKAIVKRYNNFDKINNAAGKLVVIDTTEPGDENWLRNVKGGVGEKGKVIYLDID